jgi:hypothetical protein
MKFIFTLLLTAIFFSANSQQWKMTGDYSFAAPQQQMAKNIQPIHSLQAGILYQLPKVKQLSLGIEFGIGTYARKRIDQTFEFSPGVSSVVPVDYSSNAFNANIQARFDLLSSKYFIIPYINVKGGVYNLFSTIYIDDPNDESGCHALEQKNIINDNTMYWSAGGGIQIDPAMFCKNSCAKNKGKVLFDIGANVIHGGTISYINTKHLVDAQTVTDNESKPLEVKFINASTQQIHEHTVAQVYTSPLRLVEFRAGIILVFGK